MQKSEAVALLDKPVIAWTAANGQYVGVLKEIIESRPWRGVVLITGVVEVAQHFERGSPCRRGFRPGETLEVGHSSIRPTEATGTDYLAQLHIARGKHQEWFEKNPTHRDAWIQKAFVDALTKAIAAEERRLAGEPWKLT